MDRTLDLYLTNSRSRECLKWGSINIALLSILLFDISNKCPYSFSQWYYLEYAAAAILTGSVLYYFGRYFYYLFSREALKGSDQQRKLLNFDNDDHSFITTTPASKKPTTANATPANVTSVSLHSFNESTLSAPSPGWIFNRGSPMQQGTPHGGTVQHQSFEGSFNASANNSSTFSPSFRKLANKSDFIVDEKGLQSYLK